MLAPRKISLILSLSVVALAGVFGWRVAASRTADNIPLSTTGTDIADPKRAGNVEDAMQRSRKLMTYLQTHNWPIVEDVPSELLHLPDQKYHEIPFERGDKEPSYILYDPIINHDMPELAFTSDLYVRRNVSHFRGHRASYNPNGFYIVGYRDGRVVQVPANQVRLTTSLYRKYIGEYCFPGTKCYNTDLPPRFYTSKEDSRKFDALLEQAGKENSLYFPRLRQQWAHSISRKNMTIPANAKFGPQ